MAMGTLASVQVGGPEAGRLPECAGTAREAFAEVERLMSIFNPESDISNLNAAGRGAWVAVAPLTEEVLGFALKVARLSGGAFDPTVGPLMELWGFRSKPAAHAPPETEIARALGQVGYGRLRLENGRATFDTGGGRVDLGGIAKGCAVDAAFDRIRAAGVSNILVNLGGNMRGSGTGRKPGGWAVGVRNPFAQGSILGTVRLTGGMAVATSGHYERFVVMDGRRYAHIMDPRTGRPVTGMAGVTVVSPTAGEADALSTALFVLGPEEGEKLLASFPDSRALFVPDEQPTRLIMTPGFADLFTPGPDQAR